MQFILKSLQEIYHDSERKFALGNESLVAHRKWASSSDLVSDQDKNNITLTPVSQIRIMKSPIKRTPSPTIDTSSESNLVYNGSTTSTTSEHLTASRYDKSILSPISDIDPPCSSPRKRVTYEDDLQSSLRRRSYRRAIACEEGSTALPGAIERDRSSSEKRPLTRNSDSPRRRSRSEGPQIISSMDGGSPNEARVIYQGELSNSRSSLKSLESANHRHYRAVADSRQRNGNEGSLNRRSLPPNNSPIITDRSRTSSPETTSPPRPTTPKPAPPRSVDSPRSSPRSSSSSSSKFLNPAMGRVVRSPSGTSSSSSGSEESWHSVASTSSVEGGSRRRARKMPRTPSPEDRRRGSG